MPSILPTANIDSHVTQSGEVFGHVCALVCPNDIQRRGASYTGGYIAFWAFLSRGVSSGRKFNTNPFSSVTFEFELETASGILW